MRFVHRAHHGRVPTPPTRVHGTQGLLISVVRPPVPPLFDGTRTPTFAGPVFPTELRTTGSRRDPPVLRTRRLRCGHHHRRHPKPVDKQLPNDSRNSGRTWEGRTGVLVTTTLG